ncbi:MAG: PTS sugar transporter subunit IIB [Thermotaleaceae bacterium]
MKRIIVACGSGVATSQTVASKVQDLCEQKGIRVEVDAVDIKSIDTYVKHCDLYISITPYVKNDFGVPVISGIPFLTGVGIEQTMEEVIKVLKS